MNRAFKIYSIVFSAFLLSIVIGFLYVRYALERPNYSTVGNKDIRIESGMTTSEIADMLDKNGLLSSPTLFALYVRFQRISLQAGTYQIPSDLSVVDLAKYLTNGTDDVRLTFIEGLRSEEVAEAAKKLLPTFDSNAFVSKVKSEGLEGRLFPDTYLVNKNIDAQGVIKVLTDSYKSRIEGLNLSENRAGLSEKEVLTLASIIEREERDAKEKPYIAGILIKRLKLGEVLGTDATVQYAFGKDGNWWPKEITQAMLDSENQYNTRKRAGLPPAPICNPGLSSIKSVLAYVETENLFYLHDKDGIVRYAKTIEQHNSNIAKYLSQ